MNVLSLRARTTTGEYYKFTTLDAPIIVSDTETILLGRKMSPKLLTDTIVVGDMDVYVGDVLQDEAGEEWAVTYSSGFRAHSLSRRETRFFYDFKKLTVVRQATEEEWKRLRISTPRLMYKYRNKYFDMTNIVARYRRDLIVSNIKECVCVEDVKQSLSATLGRQKLYLGDYYKGLPILMCYGRICTQNEFGAYDLFEKRYIIRTMEELER